MLEPGGDLDLAGEPLGAERGGELGAEDLHRDLAVVLQVLGEVDGGHAALAELALDAVAVGEGGLEAGHRVGHVGLGIGMVERWRNSGGRASRRTSASYRSVCDRRSRPNGWANPNANGVGPWASRWARRSTASPIVGMCPTGTHHKAT